MFLKMLAQLEKHPPLLSRFRTCQPRNLDTGDAALRSQPTPFELSYRFGFREMQAQEWSLVLALIGYTAWVAINVFVELFGSTGRFQLPNPGLMIISFVLNRFAIYQAIKLLRSIQRAVTDSREKRPEGWTRHFVALFPFAVLFPPGDLLVAAALLVFLRSSSDHLLNRQYRLFDRSQLILGIAFPLQYLLPITAALAIAQFHFPGLVQIELIDRYVDAGCQTIVLIGLWSIYLTLRSMRCELASLVEQIHWDVDPTSEFLMSIDKTATNPDWIVSFEAQPQSYVLHPSTYCDPNVTK